MKSVTMRKLGLYLILIGIICIAVGAFVVYTALRDYTDCILAASNQCVVTAQKLVQYLNSQQAGNSVTLYGMIILLAGIIFYASTEAVTPEPEKTNNTSLGQSSVDDEESSG